MSILNLTKIAIHGTEELSKGEFNEWQAVNKFAHVPTQEEVNLRKGAVLQFIKTVIADHEGVVIGGAPYFQSAIETAVKNAGKKAFYSHSVNREVPTRSRNGSTGGTKLAPVHAALIEV